MPSFKEVTGKIKHEEQGGEVTANKAASALLASHTTKDARISARMSSDLLAKFTEINKRLGAANGSVINTLVAKYVMENKDLLD